MTGSGRGLSPRERAYFEPRFGQDLSAIRIHDGADAGKAALGIGAHAYTLGQNIAVAPGAYDPETDAGRRLMSHELAHTMQQGADNAIRRTCPMDPSQIPAGGSREFEAMVDHIRSLSTYTSLAARHRAVADHIIDGARGSACPMYYITMLETVFATTESPDDEQEAEGRTEIVEAAAAEQVRLAEPEAAANTGVEEGISSDPSRQYTQRAGSRGILFDVDGRNPNNIVVRMRVRLRPAGKGTQADVDNTKSLEDGIEKAGSTRGYTLNVIFVERSGPDVFEAGVDPSQWTTAGNWVGDAQTMAHEAHHLLGLEDRYNYIESHAGNEDMDIPDRLHWFREQMVRAADPLAANSMMNDHWSSSFDDMDVCAVAGGNFAACINGRLGGLDMTELEARGRALNAPYYPQHTAIIRRMRDIWIDQCMTMQGFASQGPDPLDPYAPFLGGGPLDLLPMGPVRGYEYHAPWADDCSNPPTDAFADPAVLAVDEAAYPLSNPHDQPAGSTLARTPR